MPFVLSPAAGGGGAALPFEIDAQNPPRLYDPTQPTPFGIYDYAAGAFERRHPRPQDHPGNYLLVTGGTGIGAPTAANLQSIRDAMAGEGMALTERPSMLWDEAYLSGFDGVICFDGGSAQTQPPTGGAWTYRFPMFHMPGGSFSSAYQQAASGIGSGTTLVNGPAGTSLSLYVPQTDGSPYRALYGTDHQAISASAGNMYTSVSFVTSNAGQVWANGFGWPDRAQVFTLPGAYAFWGQNPIVDLNALGKTMQNMLLGAWLDGLNPSV